MNARATCSIVLALTMAMLSSDAVSAPAEQTIPGLVDASQFQELRSTGTANSGLNKTTTEFFWLYGEPGSGEGTFEGPLGELDWQGWTSRDLTAIERYWQVSTLNAATLGNHGEGNRAAWCGQTAEQQPGYRNPPGYGDSWWQILVWESPPLVDPSIAQDVELEFFFHYSTDKGGDFFSVAYDSAGVKPAGHPWGPGPKPFLYESGTDAEWLTGIYFPPGELFSDHAVRPIHYGGNDYGAPGEDVIRLYLRFWSDSNWSDESGMWGSNLGAVWIDDIRVRWDDGSGVIQESFEDFEGPDPIHEGEWSWSAVDFAGDFTSVLSNLSDIDPCVDNRSGVVNFIDYGQEINNAEFVQYLPGTPTSTGGSTSANWSYGLGGGWVVNHSDGVSSGAVGFKNAIDSPVIAWDLPGTADDGSDIIGAYAEFDIYEHNPLLNGVFWTWGIRSRSAGEPWGEWGGPGYLYISDPPTWSHRRFEVSEYLVAGPSEIQLSLGVHDVAAAFGFPGADSTPAPYFDNVQLRKYRVRGPILTVVRDHLAQDGFPNSGLIDASSQGARNLLDIRFDMIRDLAQPYPNSPIVPGDSIVIEAESVIPGATITGIKMMWVLDRNPLFDDVRSLPARSGLDELVDANYGPLQWSGEVNGSLVTTQSGFPVENQWLFDLPDEDFLYPGDTLRYAILVEDSDGRLSTLPHDISGISNGTNFDPSFRVRGLPSIADAAGNHSSILVVNRHRSNDGYQLLAQALGENGLLADRDFDLYRAPTPTSTSNNGNGIGSTGAHGASIEQLEGYSLIIFDWGGDWRPVDIDDGTIEESADILRLTEWHDLPGDRAMVHLGDHLIDTLIDDQVATAYIEQILGLASVTGSTDFADRAATGDPLRLVGIGPAFDRTDALGIYTGCSTFESGDAFHVSRQRDWVPPTDIQPIAPAFTSHRIEGLTSGLVNSAGIVVHDRLVEGDRKIDFTVQVPLSQMVTFQIKAANSISARAQLLKDLLAYIGFETSGVPVDAPPVLQNRLSIAPNPFNPSTTIKLRLARTGEVTIRAFDARGRAVRTLHRGVLEADTEHRLIWDGRDDQGHTLASGIYFVAIDAPGFESKKKIALIK